ncbi:MAG: extracellular solute-binding protein [Armatimonadetes bacterium]|nr:extracellular solute-binding protein [Armatimonadota bacterium]
MHGARGLAVVAIVGLGLCLAGCARRAEEVPAASDRAAVRGETTLSLWTIWTAEPRRSALGDIVTEFEAEHPEIRVAVTSLEPDAYKTVIRVGLGSASPPDIFFVWDGEWLHNFVRTGAVLDLTPHMDADGGKWRRCFLPQGLRYFTYRGRVWGVPYLLQCTFFLYNKEIFSRLGLTVPKTWPELLQVVKQLRQAGVIPIALGNQQRWPAHHFPGVLWQRLMGQTCCEANYDPLGEGKYAEREWIRGLDMFSELVRLRAFNDAPNATTRESARALFYSGQAAMFYTGTWDFARLSSGGEAPQEFWDAWDFFNFPAVPGGKGNQDALAGAPDGYVVCARSANAEAAVLFLKYLTRPDVAATFVGRCQELVQVRGAVSEANAGPRLRKYAEMVAAAPQICPWPDTLMERSVADELLNHLQAFVDGRSTPEEVMAAVRTRQAEVKQRLQAELSATGAGETRPR